MDFLYTDRDLLYIALSLINGVGFKLYSKLLANFVCIENIFSANREQLIRVTNNDFVIDSIISKVCIEDAEKLINIHRDKGIKILNFWSAFYPKKLINISDPPLLIFLRGELEVFNYSKGIGVVGTRNPTLYGQSITKEIVSGVSCVNPVVISGLAFGIDVIAHKSALECGIKTVAVCAGGLDKVYPHAHSRLAQDIIDKGGALISEYPLETSVSPFQFVARNRIIAGLCDVVVVVEAPIKSGSLITAHYANDYDREVFAVPGRLGDKTFEGSNNLISLYKAHIYLSADKLLEFLKWDSNNNKVADNSLEGNSLEGNERVIFDIICKSETKTMHIDQIVFISALPIEVVSVALLKAELAGHVKSLPGKMYQIC